MLQLINLVLATTQSAAESREKCESSTSLPTSDPTTSTAYWSLSCSGCATEVDHIRHVHPMHSLPANIDKVYSREEFLAHFQVCEKAKSLWMASVAGTKDVSHLESRFSINGGFEPMRIVPDGDRAY